MAPVTLSPVSTPPSPVVSPVVFRRAAALCYRIFDVADEIDLEAARALVKHEAKRLKLGREGSKYLELPAPPLTLELGARTLQLRHRAIPVEAALRLFNFGAASVTLRVPIEPGTSVEAFIPTADELYDSEAIDRLCLELWEGVAGTINPALQDPHLWEQTESYTVVFAEQIDGDPSAGQVLQQAPLAKLLLGEVEAVPLSDRERSEVLQHCFSYTQNDLAVIDWNCAFVYEPSGSSDVPDILEIVNAQLLELRWFDAELDAQLSQIYDEIAQKQRHWWAFVRSPYRRLSRRVLGSVLEMSEFVERVENSLKIIADFYLAKVYEASLSRLRIRAWQASVTRKQQMLDHVYTLLKGEIDTDRNLTLEAAIVVLIVFEMAIALMQAL